jgi:muconolactone delta-isomerase
MHIGYENDAPENNNEFDSEVLIMKYLVKMESIETGLLPPQQLAQVIEQNIIPGIEGCIKLEGEKKILAGGGFSGGRGGVAIVEAESNKDLSKTLQSLPFWGMMKIDVTPLEDFGDTVTTARDSLEQLKRVIQ